MIFTKGNIASIDIDKLIDEMISSGKIDELLLIVPTNRKARNLKKEIISLMPLRSVSGLNIETIGTISTKLLKETKTFIPLSEAASIVFIKQCTSEIDLKYFSLYNSKTPDSDNAAGKVKRDIPFGTLDRIKNVVSEYKRHGIYPDDIRSEAETLEKSEKLKALDIADIYEKYIQKCGLLNAYDLGDVYKNLASVSMQEFHGNFSNLFPNVGLIIVNGFDEFAGPEINILNKLAEIDQINLFVNFDYYEKNKFIFSHLDKIYRRFEELGFKKINDASRTQTKSFRDIIRDRLFLTYKNQNKLNYRDKIFLITAFDREKEIELISREIKNLIVEQKIEPHKICVGFNLIKNYSSIIRDIFQKNGLPFNLSDRISLDNSKPVTAVVNFLEILENDFYFNNIFRALSSGFIDIGDIDYSNLFRAASALKIVSGKSNWINTLLDEIANLKFKSDEDESELLMLEKSYKKALADIQTIMEVLKPFEKKLTIEEFKANLFKFVNDSKITFRLLDGKKNTADNSNEENIRGFTEFIDTTTEIFQLLEEEIGKNTKFKLTFFMDQIRTACSWARFNIKEKSNYGIQVTSLEEIRGLNFDYLFIGGLCDGDFPTRFAPEIFNSGSYKKLVVTHQTEERHLFYQALCSWNKKLYLSFPQTDSEKETVTSTFLNDFMDVFDVTSKNESDYTDVIYSYEDAQIDIAQNLGNPVPREILEKFDLGKIKNSISVSKIRENEPIGISPFTGDLSEADNEITEKLNSYSSKQYSISQLETYAKCPFKFFIERILRIEKIEEPTEDIEAVEMGRLLHEILYLFYIKIRDENIDITGSDEISFSKIKDIIWAITEEQMQKTAFRSPLTFYEREKVTGIAGNKDESILNRFLEYERGESNDFKPKYFEVSFGNIRKEGSDEILSNAEPIKIDSIKLRGKIDRIEISESEKSFNVVDYKLSGAKPSIKELKDGISLQLPVYLYAARELLMKKTGEKYSPNEMIIYSLKYSLDEFGKKIVSIKKTKDKELETVDELIELALNHIKNYISQISSGKFGLSPYENREQLVCRYCQFKSVCRVES